MTTARGLLGGVVVGLGVATPAFADTGSPAVVPEATAPASTSPPDAPRLAVAAEVFARAEQTYRDGDDLRELALDRAELGAALGLGPATAPGRYQLELRVEALRSAGAQSTFGIDGDSLVLRLKRAQLRAALPSIGAARLTAAGGLIADPWIERLDRGTTLRALSASASEGDAAWASSDVGATITVRAAQVAVTASAITGEGRRYPERNDGIDLALLIDATLVPRPSTTAPPRLALAATYRDGSLGPAAARDHRAAAAVLGAGRGARPAASRRCGCGASPATAPSPAGPVRRGPRRRSATA
ncbi:MAG: hypothetical protein R2939_18205 [Kofleriaceae bacterium]